LDHDSACPRGAETSKRTGSRRAELAPALNHGTDNRKSSFARSKS
jgi:hypothetical protein